MTFSPVSASLMSGNVVATRMKKRRLQRTQLLSRNVNSRETIDSISRPTRRVRSSPARHPPEDHLERDEDGRAGDRGDERHAHGHGQRRVAR